MPLTISIAPRENRLAPDEVAALADAVAEAGRATLVVPRFAVRDRCRRDLADAGLGVAVEVTTADAWIACLWELWGDGRQLVDAPARRLLIAEVLAEGEAAGRGRGGGCGRCPAAARDGGHGRHARPGGAGVSAPGDRWRGGGRGSHHCGASGSEGARALRGPAGRARPHGARSGGGCARDGVCARRASAAGAGPFRARAG